MSKSGSQNSRKKRDKRRLLMKQASPVRNWETLDVSGWFDTGAGTEQDDMDVFCPDDKSLPSHVYKDPLPGEVYFSWYAHEHPEREDEAFAARLVRQWVSCEKEHVTDPESLKALREPVLARLQAMAPVGCVTANAFLGCLYKDGYGGVRKNTTKAKCCLKYAAGDGDPLACYTLWTMLPEEEGQDLLNKSTEYGCPSAVQHMAYLIYLRGLEVTSSQLDSIAGWLAALAAKGSWKSLEVMLNFLSSAAGESLRSEYAPAMLRLLNKLADAGYAEAIEYQGLACMKGVLVRQDTEKAERLLKRAVEMGTETAASMYATCLMFQAKDSACSREAREGKLSEARKVLEEQCSQRKDDDVARGMLGCLLARSDNDDDFMKGMQCLEENISENMLAMPLKAVRFVFDWSGSKARHKAAMKLLNAMVRRKDSEAAYVKGRYYMLGGILRKHDAEKGLKLLHQAAELGSEEACLLLGEIYLFGLFHTGQDPEKALEMLQDGIDLGCDRCNVLYALLDLDEISAWADPPERDDIVKACLRLREHYTEDDDYMVIAYSLIRTGADNAFTRNGMNDEFPSDTASGSVEKLAEVLAEHCAICMMSGNLGPLAYMAEAMKKIAQTKYAPEYAAAFGKKIHFMQDDTCEAVCTKLESFVRDAPESFESFRIQHGAKYCEEYGPAN